MKNENPEWNKHSRPGILAAIGQWRASWRGRHGHCWSDYPRGTLATAAAHSQGWARRLSRGLWLVRTDSPALSLVSQAGRAVVSQHNLTILLLSDTEEITHLDGLQTLIKEESWTVETIYFSGSSKYPLFLATYQWQWLMLILFWSLLISRVDGGESGCWQGEQGRADQGNIDQFRKINSLN